jgi:hypothetical protein
MHFQKSSGYSAEEAMTKRLAITAGILGLFALAFCGFAYLARLPDVVSKQTSDATDDD